MTPRLTNGLAVVLVCFGIIAIGPPAAKCDTLTYITVADPFGDYLLTVAAAGPRATAFAAGDTEALFGPGIGVNYDHVDSSPAFLGFTSFFAKPGDPSRAQRIDILLNDAGATHPAEKPKCTTLGVIQGPACAPDCFQTEYGTINPARHKSHTRMGP